MIKSDKQFEQYQSFFKNWRQYWKTYGGRKGVLLSPYFGFAFVLSCCTYPIWMAQLENYYWYDPCIEIIPNLLGFTLGGFAIWLAFGDDGFRTVMAGESPNENTADPSPFMKVNSTFLHFIILQTISLFLSIIGKVWSINSGVLAFIGWTVFLYALATAFAAAFAILTLSGLFDIYVTKGREAAAAAKEREAATKEKESPS